MASLIGSKTEIGAGQWPSHGCWSSFQLAITMHQQSFAHHRFAPSTKMHSSNVQPLHYTLKDTSRTTVDTTQHCPYVAKSTNQTPPLRRHTRKLKAKMNGPTGSEKIVHTTVRLDLPAPQTSHLCSSTPSLLNRVQEPFLALLSAPSSRYGPSLSLVSVALTRKIAFHCIVNSCTCHCFNYVVPMLRCQAAHALEPAQAHRLALGRLQQLQNYCQVLASSKV